MKKIRLLDAKTINKIAAGEVVESPKSVVKELTENAIDANAGSVTIEIKEGGISYIRITDNGTGIPKEQVKEAFLRHATSKMSQIEDLEHIFTLGFRGEALASIAAVAQVNADKNQRRGNGHAHCDSCRRNTGAGGCRLSGGHFHYGAESFLQRACAQKIFEKACDRKRLCFGFGEQNRTGAS